MGNTEADGASGILRNITIVVPLKYVSSFGRFIEMLLINCEVKLKFKWPGHCVFFAASADNGNANSNNIIPTIKDTKLCVHVVKYTQRTTKNYQTF